MWLCLTSSLSLVRLSFTYVAACIRTSLLFWLNYIPFSVSTSGDSSVHLLMGIEYFQVLLLHQLRLPCGFLSPLLLWFIILIDFCVLNCPCILGLNSSWSCFNMLWIGVAVILLRVFAFLSFFLSQFEVVLFCFAFASVLIYPEFGSREWMACGRQQIL